MFPVLALVAAAASVSPIVSTDWVQAHLKDPQVSVIFTGDRGEYDKGHIPGARYVDHSDTIGPQHRLLAPETLARVLAAGGAADGKHVVLYGNSPMTTAWLYMTFASIGHGDDVSMLDGGTLLWMSEHRALSTELPAAGAGRLTVRPAPDVVVDAPWVRGHLDSPGIRLLDVRTTDEWQSGHLPGATLVLWRDLFSDLKMLRLKPVDEMRALIVNAGVKNGQQAVTYCAIGLRASLMYWAAHTAGIPARVYVGSFEDWRRDSSNPIVR